MAIREASVNGGAAANLPEFALKKPYRCVLVLLAHHIA